LNIVVHILAIAAITVVTRTVADAHPSNQHSGAECYLRGHRMYLPDGLNYPRNAWASWGISCRSPKPEGIEGTEATAAGSGDRPAEWCGWWMRQHLGGHFGSEYNAARNWLNVGRPLPGPRPGAIGVKEHHVFQVVEVIGPDQVLAISGNDHNAVRTRIRSTAGVIGWRDVTDIAITTDAGPLKKQQDEGGIDNPFAATRQARRELPSPVLDGLAW
jgi:hypothetical protein